MVLHVKRCVYFRRKIFYGFIIVAVVAVFDWLTDGNPEPKTKKCNMCCMTHACISMKPNRNQYSWIFVEQTTKKKITHKLISKFIHYAMPKRCLLDVLLLLLLLLLMLLPANVSWVLVWKCTNRVWKRDTSEHTHTTMTTKRWGWERILWYAISARIHLFIQSVIM